MNDLKFLMENENNSQQTYSDNQRNQRNCKLSTSTQGIPYHSQYNTRLLDSKIPSLNNPYQKQSLGSNVPNLNNRQYSYLSDTAKNTYLSYIDNNVKNGYNKTNAVFDTNVNIASNTSTTSKTDSNADSNADTDKEIFSYNYGDLKSDSEKLGKYVQAVGGVNDSVDNSNKYQIIYGSWDRPPIYYKDGKRLSKPTGPNNRYSNYQFGIMDAINWMIQTGGNTNFVLQYRDIQEQLDSLERFDDYAIKDISAAWQIDVIEKFVSAYNLLKHKGYNVSMPRFYIGAAEQHPETLISGIDISSKDKTKRYTSTEHKGIYEQVTDYIYNKYGNYSLIAGAYYGENISTKDADMAAVISERIHETPNSELLLIPFFELGGDQDVKGYFNRAKTFATKRYFKDGADFSVFDKVILQPGSYFYEKGNGISAFDLIDLAYSINEYNKERQDNYNSATMGIELEYDMGVVTGRNDEDYIVSPKEKKDMLKMYLLALDMLPQNTPIGIYSGGPNEQGYANPFANTNLHNLGNHLIHNSLQGYYDENNIPYSAFPGAYSNNFIYDMNNFVYRGIKSDTLKEFLQMD